MLATQRSSSAISSYTTRWMSISSSMQLSADWDIPVMSSSCASEKSVVMKGWRRADPSPWGWGKSDNAPVGDTRRLSFSIPRRRTPSPGFPLIADMPLSNSFTIVGLVSIRVANHMKRVFCSLCFYSSTQNCRWVPVEAISDQRPRFLRQH